MATNNKISAALSPADVTAILAAFVIIKTKIPFTITLTPADRKKMRKMGQKRHGYYMDVADGVNAFPSALPATFPSGEYLKDASLWAALMQIAPQLIGFAQNLDDTLMQLGSELLSNSDAAYGFLKQAAKLDSSIRPTVDKIAAGLKQEKTAKKP
jgi:hypothetical protein